MWGLIHIWMYLERESYQTQVLIELYIKDMKNFEYRGLGMFEILQWLYRGPSPCCLWPRVWHQAKYKIQIRDIRENTFKHKWNLGPNCVGAASYETKIEV